VTRKLLSGQSAAYAFGQQLDEVIFIEEAIEVSVEPALGIEHYGGGKTLD
jgi:hypothetical protein